MNPYFGEIRLFAFGYPPAGNNGPLWAPCEGQLLPIATNQALFSLLGTAYGGDGKTNFGLPDLRAQNPLTQNPGAGYYIALVGVYPARS